MICSHRFIGKYLLFDLVQFRVADSATGDVEQGFTRAGAWLSGMG